MPKVDLHFHSNHSDGKLSVEELANLIIANKIEVCSLTDHDTVNGVADFINILNKKRIKVIPGAELTAKFNGNEIHLLAYNFDINNAKKILDERNEIITKQKTDEMRNAIILTKEQGFTLAEGLSPVSKQPVTLTLALNICQNEINQEILISRHGKAFTPEDFFYEYQAPGKSCHVERSGVTAEWLRNKFNGVAQSLIIAHPFVSVSVVAKPLTQVGIEILIKSGLTGVEVYHDHTTDEQIAYLERLVANRGIHYTGGSDSHGKPNDTPFGEYGQGRLIPGFKF